MMRMKEDQVTDDPEEVEDDVDQDDDEGRRS